MDWWNDRRYQPMCQVPYITGQRETGTSPAPASAAGLVEVAGGYLGGQGTARPGERVVQVRRVRLDSPRIRSRCTSPDRCLISGSLAVGAAWREAARRG